MANQQPFFITGANAVITLNGLVVGFATDVSYRISVRHEAPRLLGKFETEPHQPVAYNVSGSFTMIRYARGIKAMMEKSVNSANNLGNSIGNFIDTADSGKAEASFNPGKLLTAKAFDISIYQKTVKSSQTDVGPLSGGDMCEMARLRKCRISAADFTLNRKGLAQQRFNFVAQYADEDGFIAEKSGTGQELTGINEGD